jgi:hypothetical protein
MVVARAAILLWSFAFLFASAFSQFPVPTPTPTPRPGSRAAAVPAVVRDNSSYDRLRTIESMTDKTYIPRHPMLDRKTGIYRRPGAEESRALAVSETLIREFEAFLAGPDTGIVKLNGDSSCFSSVEVVNVNEKCAPFKMPGAGTAFSFRIDGYRLPRLADLILFNGTFRADAVLQHVAMVELGNIAIADVNLELGGMKYLVELQPTRDGDKFLQYDSELTRGISANGYFYRKGHPVKPDTTYALRSIAYRGSYLRAVDKITYDELDFDRRRDVIVAFRVVETEESGNVTILWKRLRDLEAPKLNIKN